MALLQNRYKLLSKLGRGSYGTVYSAHDTVLGVSVAIKICEAQTSLSHEVDMYNLLNRVPAPVGIPKFYEYMVEANRQEFFTMELLGPSLSSLWYSRGKSFTPKTVAMLGIQMISRLESLHDRGIVHCDVKDDNFLMSSGIVYIIDFGLCKTFIDPNTNAHLTEDMYPLNLGTILFASVNTHRTVMSTRRDDMESLGYVFVRWFRGYLRWEQLPDDAHVYEEAGLMKEATSTETLCRGIPKEFQAYMNHVKNLRFDERPNYEYLRYVLSSLIERKGESNDGIYDWMHA